MEMRNRGYVVVVVLGSLCLAGPGAAYAAGHSADKGSAKSEIVPQLVRIRYLEGDVRVSRAVASSKAPKADWEVAIEGLPIETGYDIATGSNGRAEIEFEDASTVYLAGDSVLAFNDIHSKDDVPYTSLALLTGTMTIHTEKSFDGGTFLVRTPTGSLIAAADQSTYLRLSSFLDGFALSARAPVKMRLPDGTSPVTETPQEKTIYYAGDKIVGAPADPARAQRLAAWDEWVNERVTARNTEMAAVMKQSGIDRPLPGLADMYQKGTFYKCEPYGTCWVPGQQNAARSVPAAAQSAAHGGGPAAPSMDGSGQGPYYGWGLPPMIGFGFPCDPMWMYDASLASDWTSYDWGLCSYGSWIPCNNGYAWVAPATQSGPLHLRYRLHHYPPVRWVRYGGKIGYVPLHPRDVAGKPPLNRVHGIFLPRGKTIERVAFSPQTSFKPLRSEPGRYMRPVYSRLARASAPRPVIRSVKPVGKVLAGTRTASSARLAYNHSSQSFLLVRAVEVHGKTVARTQSFMGGNGSLQARAIGVNSHGGYNSTISYGGFRFGRIGPSGGIRGVSTLASMNSGYNGFNDGGMSGGGYSGGGSGGSMPAASGGPVSSAGGARR